MDRVGTRMDAGAEVVLTTDLYEITMAASYLALGIRGHATFSLFVRKLPPQRSFLVAAGLDAALDRIGGFAFDHEALEYLGSIGMVRSDVLAELADIRFRGDVRAVREGRVIFADEAILEVTAPIVEAQLVETAILNAIHFPTLVATKAARCVGAAKGRSLVDFGLRRTPGIEAGLTVREPATSLGWTPRATWLRVPRPGRCVWRRSRRRRQG